MAKVIFFSIPAHGHTNPTLPVVKELVRRGEDVIYYSSPEFKDQVLSTGAIFQDYRNNQDNDFIQQTGKDIALLYYFLVKTTQNILDTLLRDVHRINPDYILHDAICPWGRYVAAICNLPAVTSVPTFVLNPRVVNLQKTLDFFRRSPLQSIRYILAARNIQKELQKKYGIQPRGFVQTMMNEEDLNIVYTSTRMQPDAGRLDPAKYKFVGPSIAERCKDPDTTDYSKLKHPLIYVSMGTIWKDSFMVEDLVETLLDFNGTLVVSGTAETQKFEHSENVIIKSHINQLEVLKYCDVFITHGGMNSVNEALYWGVPMYLHPFQVEQDIVVDRVVELQCGLRIKQFKPENVRQGVQKLLEDRRFRDNCAVIAQSFKMAGGYQQAADYILEFINGRV